MGLFDDFLLPGQKPDAPVEPPAAAPPAPNGMFDDLVPQGAEKPLFDQFSGNAPTPGEIVGQQATGQLGDVRPPEANIATDVAKSLGSGLVRGTTELGMSPLTVPMAVKSGVARGLGGIEGMVRSALGMPDTPAGAYETPNNPIADIGMKGVEAVRGAEDATLHTPQTTPGKYAQTIGEFVPGAVAPVAKASGLVNGIERAVGHAVLPAVGSETAGEVAHSYAPSMEPAARVIGAFAGGVPAAFARTNMNPADRAIFNAVGGRGGVQPGEFDLASQLQRRSFVPGEGVPLTGAEALDHTTNGRTALGNIMRVVESSPNGGSALSRLFSQRPAATGAAVGTNLNRISPAVQDPALMSQQVRDAAQGSIDAAGRQINDITRPAYQAAEPQLITGRDMQPIRNAPGFRGAVMGIRGNTDLPAVLRKAPYNSVRMIDAASKVMRQRGEQAGTVADGMAPLTSSRLRTDAQDIRQQAGNVVPEYADAVGQQRDLRSMFVDPLERGPVGQLANITPGPEGAAKAGSILLPNKPDVHSEASYVDTVNRLRDTGDPQLPASLVRQTLDQALNNAGKRTQTGIPAALAVKFANSVAGNPQQEANLTNVVGHAASPQVAGQLGDLLDNLRATGRRLNPGSPTYDKQVLSEDISRAPSIQAALAGAKTLGMTYFKRIDQNLKRANMGKSIDELAATLSNPQGVRIIQRIAQEGGGHPYLANAARSLVQGLYGK